MILWTRVPKINDPTRRYATTAGKVEIVQHLPKSRNRSSQFQSSYGACIFDDWRDPDNRLLLLFKAFNWLTGSEGLDPKVTHEAFLVIPEFRQAINRDQFGATYIDDQGVEMLRQSDNPFNQTNLETTRRI